MESGWKPSEEDKRFVVHVMCYMGCWGTSEGNFPNFSPLIGCGLFWDSDIYVKLAMALVM